MPSYRSRWPVYAHEWDGMTLKTGQLSEITATARRLVAAKARYQAVEKVTGVPWYWIACVHERESSQDWKASLAQGDPWNRVSTHVPRGRGPFTSWEAAAVDALQLDGVSDVKDWTLEKLFYYWELYNGWGYYNHGIPSPYVWGATSVQRPGKYVADGVWSSTAVDKQLGCAALLRGMMKLDPTIKPVRETEGDTPPSLTGPKWVQASLNKIMAIKPPLVVDGDLGPLTRAALIQFQLEHGLVGDGKVGDLTLAALDAALAQVAPKAASVKVVPANTTGKSWWRRLLGL